LRIRGVFEQRTAETVTSCFALLVELVSQGNLKSGQTSPQKERGATRMTMTISAFDSLLLIASPGNPSPAERPQRPFVHQQPVVPFEFKIYHDQTRYL
jgi:hypothetical protein